MISVAQIWLKKTVIQVWNGYEHVLLPADANQNKETIIHDQ